MTTLILLDRLTDFTRDAVKDLMLPVRQQENDAGHDDQTGRQDQTQSGIVFRHGHGCGRKNDRRRRSRRNQRETAGTQQTIVQ